MRPFPNKKYQIIYADPPWSYANKSPKRSVERNYNTLSKDQLRQLPIDSIKNDSTVCLMWATFPQLETAIYVIQQWGFIYKTVAFVWVKTNRQSNSLFWGMGNYTRANAEVCLLGVSTKTKASECVQSHRVHQVICSPIETHSKKPEVTKTRIVELFGDIPRIELFARKQTSGWDVWGNETSKFPAE